MAGARLHVMALECGTEVRAQIQGRRGMSEAADIIALAFDGEQKGLFDISGRTGRPRYFNSPLASS